MNCTMETSILEIKKLYNMCLYFWIKIGLLVKHLNIPFHHDTRLSVFAYNCRAMIHLNRIKLNLQLSLRVFTIVIILGKMTRKGNKEEGKRGGGMHPIPSTVSWEKQKLNPKSNKANLMCILRNYSPTQFPPSHGSCVFIVYVCVCLF